MVSILSSASFLTTAASGSCDKSGVKTPTRMAILSPFLADKRDGHFTPREESLFEWAYQCPPSARGVASAPASPSAHLIAPAYISCIAGLSQFSGTCPRLE